MHVLDADDDSLQIPLERLLLETDAPDGRPCLGDPYQERLLTVQSQDGTENQELNHPANIRQAAITVCQKLHMPGHSNVIQQTECVSSATMAILQVGQVWAGCEKFISAKLVNVLLLGLLLVALEFWALVPGDVFAVSYCRVMLELLADIRGQQVDMIADATFTNAKSIFSFASQ